MFDPRDLVREDTPTPRPTCEDAPRADQARSGAPGQARPAREDRAREGPRAGHRREHDAREQDPDARQRPRRSIGERKRAATADVGMYRAVSYRDLSDTHFDGHRRRRGRPARSGWIGGAVGMQPIAIAVGLTVTILALTAYGVAGVVTLAVAIYATARAVGLADLGRKVDLVERSIRRGAGGDPELADQMQQQDRGEFQE